MVNLHFGFTWNHLGDTLSGCVCENGEGKTDPKCGWHNPMDWDFRLNEKPKEETATPLPAGGRLVWLPAAMLPHCDQLPPSNCEPKQILLPSSRLLQVFCWHSGGRNKWLAVNSELSGWEKWQLAADSPYLSSPRPHVEARPSNQRCSTQEWGGAKQVWFPQLALFVCTLPAEWIIRVGKTAMMTQSYLEYFFFFFPVLTQWSLVSLQRTFGQKNSGKQGHSLLILEFCSAILSQ